nr:polymorphic toxin-type HINT domain-containing protein [Streptomyces sp. S1D4-11]QIY98055.1 hypothetical protein HEP87_33905 [Streptomyces sp. S1D4-11]
MKNGHTKAIAKIKPGDHVEAADPKTGKHAGARRVTARLVHQDDDLVDLKIRDKHGNSATLHTTSNHPFWDDTARTWVEAGSLKPGHDLNTPTGQHARLVATTPLSGEAAMYNLTVEQLHTYYVLAGNTPVLVHNSSCVPPLRALHSNETLERSNKTSIDHWSKQSTDDIVASLRPGQHEALIVRDDGLVMNGNTRVYVLRSRGYDVDSLPRESYGSSGPQTEDEWWDLGG